MTPKITSPNPWFYLQRIGFFSLIAAGLAWLALKHGHLLSGLGQVSLAGATLVLVVKAVTTWVNALRLKVMMEIYGVHLRSEEWFGLTVATTFFAYLVPAQLGHVPRAIYLRRHHGFSYSHYGSLMLYANMLNALVIAGVALGVTNTLAVNPVAEGASINRALSLVLVVTGGAWVTMLLATRVPIGTGNHRFAKAVSDFRNGGREFHRHPGSLANLVLLHVVSLVTQAAGLYVSFMATGSYPSVTVVFVLASVLALTSIITITPSNLGVSEGVVFLVGVGLGMSAGEVVPGLLASRVGSIVVHVVLGAWYSARLFGTPWGWRGARPDSVSP